MDKNRKPPDQALLFPASGWGGGKEDVVAGLAGAVAGKAARAGL